MPPAMPRSPFLLMDLHVRGLASLAAMLLDACPAHVQDQSGLPLLPLFPALRASLRAYALADADGADRQSDPAEAARRRTQARPHLRAAGVFLSHNDELPDDL